MVLSCVVFVSWFGFICWMCVIHVVVVCVCVCGDGWVVECRMSGGYGFVVHV